ncbi:MAG: PQQ-binding-like beta-propeller repeat protein [Fimbriiglobus sp.]
MDANTGKEVWAYSVPCKGNLDYGNSPRATPVVAESHVFVFGAFGNLACLDRKTGEPVWELGLQDEFPPTELPKWGTCSTPLLIKDKLIVNPGAKDASLVALEAKSGKVLWKTSGKAAGYGSLIYAELGGVNQIVGHDATTLGGWNPDTGERLWTLRPPVGNDFNVPTPIAHNGQLIVSTENNGTRIYGFEKGKIRPEPLAVNKKLGPDTHSPVLVGTRLFGVWRGLYCLDVTKKLRPIWTSENQAYQKYATIVATEERVLVMTLDAQFILVDAKAEEYVELARARWHPEEQGLYAHPAFVGKSVFLRTQTSIDRLDLT